MSQSDLAKKAKVSQQLISQLERGKNLTTKKLPQIARALNATIQEVDPNYADDDASRARLLAVYDALDPDLRPVAVARIEALAGPKSVPPPEAERRTGARVRR